MSERITIFSDPDGHREVWRDGDDYGTFGAGHALCVLMAKEIERLRAAPSTPRVEVSDAMAVAGLDRFYSHEPGACRYGAQTIDEMRAAILAALRAGEVNRE